eukprot:scaffold35830_cov28-Attheya_sp.AAC.1
MAIGFEERFRCIDSKEQIKKWHATTEDGTHFPWWQLPSNAKRINIRCWTKRISHERSLIHSELVYFGHTKSGGDLDVKREQCHMRYNKKMSTQDKVQQKRKKKGTNNIEPISKQSKQCKQRILLHDSIKLRGSKENNQYLDTLSFGWKSEDGT